MAENSNSIMSLELTEADECFICRMGVNGHLQKICRPLTHHNEADEKYSCSEKEKLQIERQSKERSYLSSFRRSVCSN